MLKSDITINHATKNLEAFYSRVNIRINLKDTKWHIEI